MLYNVSQITDSKSTIEHRIVHSCDYLIKMRLGRKWNLSIYFFTVHPAYQYLYNSQPGKWRLYGDRNVQAEQPRSTSWVHASNFVLYFQISLTTTFGWHVWYQFVGKRILHMSMPILLLQNDQLWIFGMSSASNVLFISWFVRLIRLSSAQFVMMSELLTCVLAMLCNLQSPLVMSM